MRRAVVVSMLVGVAVRANATQQKAPCAGCTFEISSAATEPVPLVVVMHGDTDTARQRAMKWRAAVERKGWALLALDCPDELGCDRSWYKWDHDPAWVHEQVREVIAHHPIDRTRIYLVGWSGGATYIGMHLQAWPPTFAAAVIHGGGVEPLTSECPDRPFPAYFLVGDENPSHGGEKRLRAFFTACNEDVRWDLVRGADHAGEDAALTEAKADQILSWLETKRRAAPLRGRAGNSSNASI
ncbi:MAG TPA: PHB depolymerase family esterase [Kofleriaceae bacterium]|nr:PHB depolymerase family esterase [Kofleriaceae bacterium]